MIANEFFKSIVRVFGRVVAYILLGVLAYFIFTWFGIDSSRVHAQSYSANGYNIRAIDQSYNTLCSHNNVTSQTCGHTQGYYVEPVYNGNEIPFTITDYSISYKYRLTYENNGTYPYPVSMFFYNGGIQGVCDGTENLVVTETGTISGDYYVTYEYSCSKLSVTQNFRYMLFVMGPVANNSNAVTYRIQVYEAKFTDLNEIDSNTQLINQNNDKNTNKIITKLSDMQTWWNNSTSSINSNATTNANNIISQIQSSNNGVIQQIINSGNSTNNAVANLDTTMKDENGPSVNLLSGVQNFYPSDTPITDIITLPISILNKSINGLNGTCQAWSINTGTLLGNHTWTIPCINPSTYLSGYSYGGYNLWQLIDLMICMYMGYEILMLIISAYTSITNLDDTFRGLYSPRHSGYAMKHAEGRLT